jgi:hypothetical protein
MRRKIEIILCNLLVFSKISTNVVTQGGIEAVCETPFMLNRDAQCFVERTAISTPLQVEIVIHIMLPRHLPRKDVA